MAYIYVTCEILYVHLVDCEEQHCSGTEAIRPGNVFAKCFSGESYNGNLMYYNNLLPLLFCYKYTMASKGSHVNRDSSLRNA